MKKKNDVLVFGLAIFAMFFGAGNLIFPPEIGLATGNEWILSFLGFFLTGICIPIAGIFAFSKVGDVNGFASKISGRFNTAFFSILILAIGPMLAIPRTAATAYEMGISTNFDGVNPLLFSVIYTGIAYAFVMNKSKLMNNIGKYLTPVILAILGIIIVKGVFTGFGAPAEKLITSNTFSYGFLGGYQTMDALASVIFGVVIVNSLKSNGYTRKSEQRSMLVKSGIVAGLGLVFVYGGLLYLGAMANGLGREFTKVELVMYFANETMGGIGTMALGACVTLACLTTSIALVATVSEFFSERTALSYRTIAILTCIASSILAATGLGFIIHISAPILTILYPVTIILIGLNIIGVEDRSVFKTAVFTGLFFSILEVAAKSGLSQELYTVYSALPLSAEGLSWAFPAAGAALIARVAGRTRAMQATTSK